MFHIGRKHIVYDKESVKKYFKRFISLGYENEECFLDTFLNNNGINDDTKLSDKKFEKLMTKLIDEYYNWAENIKLKKEQI